MYAHVVKQAEVQEVQVGENMFYLRPFPAFKAVRMTGELSTIAGPVLASIAALAVNDTDTADAIPAIVQAFQSLSGDKLERLMKELLTANRNIMVDVEGKEDAQILTEDLANELFCREVQEMFLLAFRVIQLNFSGFFRKLKTRFGGAFEKLQSTLTNMEPSTAAGSAN